MSAYSTVAMNFGQALEVLKHSAGARVRRAGWNGKGMWLRMVTAGAYGVAVELTFDSADGRPELAPWIGMRTADNKFVPWLASQTDILAEDWEVLHEASSSTV